MAAATDTLPPRFRHPGLRLLSTALPLILFLYGLHYLDFLAMTPADYLAMPLNAVRFIGGMFPPSMASLGKIFAGVYETILMAIWGTVIGAVLSIPLGILAARKTTPTPIIRSAAMAFIGICRAVPDLVWALFFVIIVGLNPLAGALTLVVDTIGFAARFFAHAVDSTDQEPIDGLSTIGATYLGVILCAIIPQTIPSAVHIFVFSIERAVQSSVLLGFVGAGGIGMLLEEPMTWHNYPEAATVIIVISLLLIAIEQIGIALRHAIHEKNPAIKELYDEPLHN